MLRSRNPRMYDKQSRLHVLNSVKLENVTYSKYYHVFTQTLNLYDGAINLRKLWKSTLSPQGTAQIFALNLHTQKFECKVLLKLSCYLTKFRMNQVNRSEVQSTSWMGLHLYWIYHYIIQLVIKLREKENTTWNCAPPTGQGLELAQ